MLVDYTALRSLKAGHTVDLVYQIDLSLSQSNPIPTVVGKRNVAISGSTVNTIHRSDIIYDFTSVIISDTSIPDNADMIEFLESVKFGERFQLDITGTSIDFIMDRFEDPYRVRRIGFAENYTYSFRARAV